MDTEQTLHNNMVLDLSRSIAPGIDGWTELLDLFNNNPLSKTEINAITSMQKLFEKLVDYETIKVGKYGKVIKLLQSNGKEQFNVLVKIMQNCQDAIAEMKNAAGNQLKPADNTGTPMQSVKKSEAPSNQLTSDDKTETTMQSDREHLSPEVTPQNVGPSGGPSSDKYPRSYTKREARGKKGLMVIFNFTFKGENSERKHAPVDKKHLTDFFKNELGWYVKDHEDCTVAEVQKYLEQARTTLKKDKYNNGSCKYYCLFVAVMSHGEEEYFITKGGTKFKYADVFSAFTNKKLPEFAGRPKVFLMQSCKGKELQNDIHSDHIHDKCPILDDSDILVIWATTPGCKAFAKSSDGSFLIEVTIKHFQKKFASDDVECMLSDIRRTIAYDPKYRSTPDATEPYRQMPCTWSTLTDKLYLIRYHCLLGKRPR
ncbi:caspase-3-like [Mizuhopecten yessoensis]|uniref:Caspase-1 n=1 Tax=Mizuhopecten yessoensis TaxID=6573 RepID=A0A210QJA9_MIZYE|nr:caspase-3-like [Mizuhopecten yessoensis]OWF48832.1 Caspase-1 [Mizuhopecten yessoensis]